MAPSPETPTARLAEGAATTRWLLAARVVRSIGQGAMVVDFALYLHALRWSAPQISLVLSVALLVGAVLTLLVGPLSDRIGRRGFLLGYELVQALACLGALLSANAWVVGIAGIVGGFGRGGNGAAGPFAPVEMAWLAQNVPTHARGQVYSINAAGGFAGMGVGAVLAASPGWFAAALPGALAYRPLFLLALLCSLACFAMLLPARDQMPTARAAAPPIAEERETRRRENARMRRLALANALNGIGIGLTGPLISYWFAVRFGKGPELIGPLMAISFVLTGMASLLAGRAARACGMVRAVEVMRLAGLVLRLALPFAPSFMLAALLYTARSVFNRGTTGARSALSVSIVRSSRRGFAASMANISMQIPRAVGPLLAGLLFADGLLALPFLLGAAFQGGYIWIYGRSFRDVDPQAANS
ncbi:MAG: MFS transporter [Rhodospirillales bacterium]|nr:MFS transporter [Rhodospirillales bacterium]